MDNEQLKFIFNLASGDTQTVLIPVGALIREWEPVNKDTSPIELTRVQSTPETDKLSADVRLSTKAHNILEKDGNTLYVKGTTDNLYHAGEVLETYLNELSADLQAKYRELSGATGANSDLATNIPNLQKELDALTATESADKSELQKAISAEQARALSVEQSLQSAIDSEENRAKAAEEANAKLIQSLDGKLSAEIARSTEKDAELAQQIQNVVHPESGSVGTPDSEINVVKTDLATETSERKSKDSALESKIDTEITRAKEKDEALDKSITDEIARAKAAEEALAEQAADYTLTESQSTDPQYKSVYNLTKNGIATGATIKVPKAMTIKTEDKSLVFTPNTDNPSEVSAKVNIKTGGGINLDDDGLSVDNAALTKYTGSNAVSVQEADGTNTKKIVLVLDPDSEDYLSITENGLKLAGIQALAEKLDELDWAEPDA